MIRDINFGQYIRGDSVLHRSDPRTKIILTVLFMILVLAIHSIVLYLVSLAFLLFAVLASKIGINTVIRGIRPLLMLMIIMALFNFFGSSGTEIWRWHFLVITDHSIPNTILIVLRLLVLIVGASLLTYCTTPTQLTDGIETLFSPIKKTRRLVHMIAMMMTIALRFIPTLTEEADKIIKAQTARGAELDSGGMIHRIRGYIPIIIPLLIGAVIRATELSTAMESRCYKGIEGRTRYKVLRFKKEDAIVVFSFSVFVAFVIVLRYNFY